MVIERFPDKWVVLTEPRDCKRRHDFKWLILQIIVYSRIFQSNITYLKHSSGWQHYHLLKTFVNKWNSDNWVPEELPKYNRTTSWVLIYMPNKRHLNNPCDSFSSDCITVLDHLKVDVVLTNTMKQNIQCFMNYQQVIMSTAQHKIWPFPFYNQALKILLAVRRSPLSWASTNEPKH